MLKVSSDIPIPYGRGCLLKAFGQQYHGAVHDGIYIENRDIEIRQWRYQSVIPWDTKPTKRVRDGLITNSEAIHFDFTRIFNRPKSKRQLLHSKIFQIVNSCHLQLQKLPSVIKGSIESKNHYSRIPCNRQNNRPSQFLDKPDLISYSLA